MYIQILRSIGLCLGQNVKSLILRHVCFLARGVIRLYRSGPFKGLYKAIWGPLKGYIRLCRALKGYIGYVRAI